ncbi:MAG TPA: HAMP domain-containing sensor histidine kinase [Chthoniobacteraceae bacterium]|nr:HAMP domain-containing sensor histidine kinase [Chthoniobacteraceae bacterium]
MHIDQSDFHDQLVRGLTHKMNNILSLFHGYLGLLMDDKKLDPSTVAGLARIRDGAKAASELMDRTKVLARPSSVVWREVNVADLFKRMKPDFETACERGVELQIDLPENLPAIWTDTARLKTAIFELVRNACEASPPGEIVKIEVIAESQSSATPSAAGKAAQPITWISINVTDNGGGIAPELSEKIFHPFFSTKQKQNATGLGLTVALGLVQQLGGGLRYQSKPGQTTFRLLLPSRTKLV